MKAKCSCIDKLSRITVTCWWYTTICLLLQIIQSNSTVFKWSERCKRFDFNKFIEIIIRTNLIYWMKSLIMEAPFFMNIPTFFYKKWVPKLVNRDLFTYFSLAIRWKPEWSRVTSHTAIKSLGNNAGGAAQDPQQHIHKKFEFGVRNYPTPHETLEKHI